MAAKYTTYTESLYEGQEMAEAIGRVLSEKRTGTLVLNLICGGVASLKWTEKAPKNGNGNGYAKVSP